MARKKSSADKPLSSSKPAKKAGVETYPLRLTRLQRESMCLYTRIRRAIKDRMEELGDGTKVLEVTEKELLHLEEELTDAQDVGGAASKRLVAVLERISELLDGEPKSHEKVSSKSNVVYQFKVTLRDIKPVIWRQIEVPEGTLGDLHYSIQAAFGWTNSHMHAFHIGGKEYGSPSPIAMGFDDEDIVDEESVTLEKLLPKTSERRAPWQYVYDFGDNWRHEIAFQKLLTRDPKKKYPLCSDGARACPPDDIGGPWGYPDYVAAITDKKHPDHQRMLEWGGSFDPEEFDAAKATQNIRRWIR